MQNPLKSGVFAAIGVTISLVLLSPDDALAGVTSVASKSVVSPPSAVEAAHYSSRQHRHYVRYANHRRPIRRHHALRYYRYGYDPAAAVITSAAAGVIAAGAYSPYYAYPYGGYGYGYGYRYPSYGYGWGGGPVVYGGGWGYRPRYGGWGGGVHHVGGWGGGWGHGGFHHGGFGHGGFGHGGFGHGGWGGGGFHHGGFGGGFHGGGFHHR
ncbi:hypothetical protein EDE12_1011075 [Methylosinus sp. sav-2]|uniref:hypothetical protein n=1 Tax=Methylosinus sp. sav-2 TaxID=2485168 RepID=UPI000B291D30|nr:hypothetical protein [Methylosinus sp. sav-2]TDX67527.1 hypothetical protein EDE12_1011075 [Methylosinus sp. sav-2]